MNTAIQALARTAQQVPGYCTSGTGVHTPQQWQTCWKLGWQQPVNTTVAHAGSAAGTGALPAVVIIAIILAVLVLSRRSRPGKAAAN